MSRARRNLPAKMAGAVAVKVAKLNHDMRFDVPCLGPQTLETCAKSGVAVLAFESGRSLVLEQRDLRDVGGKTQTGDHDGGLVPWALNRNLFLILISPCPTSGWGKNGNRTRGLTGPVRL